MDQQLSIYIKSLSGQALKITIQGKTMISEIKCMVKEKKYQDMDTSSFKLMLKGQELKDNQHAVNIPLKQGDQLILMIAKSKDKTQSIAKFQNHPLSLETLETGEEYKKAVEDLVQLGFRREDVISALRSCDKNLKKTICFLINKERKIFIGAEIEIEEQEIKEDDLQLNLDNMKIQALKDSPLVQKLMESVRGDPELWIQTMQQMQSSNQNIYNDIIENQNVFFEILNEKREQKDGNSEEFQIINQDDAMIIAQIQEINPFIPQGQIIKQFIKNNKNPHKTIQDLNLVNNT